MIIKNLIRELPWHPNRIWGKRELRQIKKIIIHQEMGESSIEQVNKYHTKPGVQNHISEKGCPHFCYHYGIRKNGEIVQANELSDIVWHCSGQNTSAVGIMLEGNFAGPGHELGTSAPTGEQLKAIENLVNFLLKSLQLSNYDVFGHYHFGKPACPGYIIQEWIEKKRPETNFMNKVEVEKSATNVQKLLKKLDYAVGKADGIMGVKTLAAIKNFQADHQLEVDGIVGPQTWNTLTKLTSLS
ncbi:peptidoglycan recognition protein family protein [Sunxiuqinia sp. A32]|uniref:peptidoglycan recognition protein family protein n=1 Tax=Sunxiuqinia sp. A32 TaxID=3461496 RepID=UPI00404629D0